MDISGPWSTTGRATPVPFLIYDNGAGSSQRLIVFSSPEQLRQLAIATQWFMDGTFKTATRLFQQLYVIRAAVGESAISCVYALKTGWNRQFLFYLKKGVTF